MCAGVGKSGSPAPNPMTSRPAAFIAFAFASTARVADSAMPAMRADTRGRAGTAAAEGDVMARIVVGPEREVEGFPEVRPGASRSRTLTNPGLRGPAQACPDPDNSKGQ